MKRILVIAIILALMPCAAHAGRGGSFGRSGSSFSRSFSSGSTSRSFNSAARPAPSYSSRSTVINNTTVHNYSNPNVVHHWWGGGYGGYGGYGGGGSSPWFWLWLMDRPQNTVVAQPMIAGSAPGAYGPIQPQPYYQAQSNIVPDMLAWLALILVIICLIGITKIWW